MILSLSEYFSNLTPVTIEVLKIIGVSVCWIGGLVTWLYWREKHRSNFESK